MFLGVDVGSISTDAVLIDSQKNILSYYIVKSGFDHKAAVDKVLKGVCEGAGIKSKNIIKMVGTGYGRRNVSGIYKSVTEISCHAMGIHTIFPTVRTLIDIGGQDSKVIRISEEGFVETFVMNDKCAAGTGRFLEVMANAMDVGVEMLGEYSSRATKAVKISSTCTIFAESEVISRISQGDTEEQIIAGVHNAIADRIVAMVNSIGLKKDLALTGGVAKNEGIKAALEKKFGKILVPEEPQITGALGAAIYALNYKES
ncbi:acyl-CoA dehydratase activase [Alkaliphilus peptidifermentans]|uniref:CoA-substrate-specific enzyme activase, putative n=1 Tax=Alkaliphilus peptidifermentans DSM 18978 TaxID=1120976 RepID=A0A1G5I490_9FIRM|nr:acyl-CoA dehydratase activase [Alkaliphilus peptidifermentans]SCY70480.1 CoA-substrate-specific enzyme activase, putative [Alkaliphilus peptidifermentans DSM 18978]